MKFKHTRTIWAPDQFFQKGSSLVTEMNRKVEKLKADLELILKKIEVIDQSMKNE